MKDHLQFREALQQCALCGLEVGTLDPPPGRTRTTLLTCGHAFCSYCLDDKTRPSRVMVGGTAVKLAIRCHSCQFVTMCEKVEDLPSLSKGEYAEKLY